MRKREVEQTEAAAGAVIGCVTVGCCVVGLLVLAVLVIVYLAG